MDISKSSERGYGFLIHTINTVQWGWKSGLTKEEAEELFNFVHNQISSTTSNVKNKYNRPKSSIFLIEFTDNKTTFAVDKIICVELIVPNMKEIS